MPQRTRSARAKAQHIQNIIQKCVQRNQDNIKGEFTQYCGKSTLLTSNSLTECDNSDSDLDSVSDHFSDIEEESKLKAFTQALQKAQIDALKKENRNRQRGYTKQSKDTLRHCRQVHIKLASKGFLSVDEYMRLKRVPTERDKPTPEANMEDQSTVLEEGSIIDNI
jgi:hypothetical protein